MTTAKQAAANKANAQKSTGAKTPEGKAVVATNAIRHGLLSSRLFLDGESPEDYRLLLDGLIRSVSPIGNLELVLVEKIAIAIWKQRRMVAAESAAIELSRQIGRPENLKAIEQAMGKTWDEASISREEATTESDAEQAEWCAGVIAEYRALDQAVIDNKDLGRMAKESPLLWEQLGAEAEDEGLGVDAYLLTCDDHLAGWAAEAVSWCEKELAKHKRRDRVRELARLVMAEKSAPVANELMLRYQIALDGELYRAAEALRKQQEWRIKSGIEIEAEPV